MSSLLICDSPDIERGVVQGIAISIVPGSGMLPRFRIATGSTAPSRGSSRWLTSAAPLRSDWK
jgi:hypothetical protein